jgi:mannose-1-phosphate guanylyltransferase
MKIILLSGGAGKRLWPLSNDLLPKQFMKVLGNKFGESISMLQKTWHVLAEKFGPENLFVAGNRLHELMLREQLGPDASLIFEPSQRDTFPAIALATSYLHAEAGASLDETIVTLPVDTYTDPSFYDCLHQLDAIIQQDAAPLALIGIRPRYAAEKFGYLLPAKQKADLPFGLVQSFVEKPDITTAMKLVGQGALWNGGVFAFRLNYLKSLVTRMNFPWSYPELYAHYESMPRISFDYMVVEPEKQMAFVPYDGEWTDLGTWSEMVRILGHNTCEKVIKDEHSQDTYVINQLGIPIIIAGISHAVIAAGPDGILISDKNVTHQIKPLVERVQLQN